MHIPASSPQFYFSSQANRSGSFAPAFTNTAQDDFKPQFQGKNEPVPPSDEVSDQEAQDAANFGPLAALVRDVTDDEWGYIIPRWIKFPEIQSFLLKNEHLLLG